MSDSAGVQVAVRVRPFNDREKNLNAVCCVEMEGPTTRIRNMDEPEAEPKKFTFDYSFWSHDQFYNDDAGISHPNPGSNYADQQHVFETIGKGVLDNAWKGYHCCLFAYGQTGAGKSYSMVGYGANKGIVPIACEEIFRRIDSMQSEEQQFEVSVSMLEIYNEMVQDLLLHPSQRSKKGLEIRESKQLGIFVKDLSKSPVASYEAIEKVVDKGTSNRTVGATLMNATSSRAHTVIMIEFRQITVFGGKKGQKISMINLVDLAGSEKAGQTGATGDRLKEGCAINKSLSALGNVISALADKATGKLKAGQPVPYRDSKLTRLLQNALGGSSKTVMICAISPASSNYEETLSTLRYADRAKKIQNVAVVNEDPQDKLIRQLKEENERLKAMVTQGGGGAVDEEAMRKQQEEVRAMEEMLKEMQKTWEEKLKEAEAKAQTDGRGMFTSVDLSDVHITNLNEDPQLSGKVHYPLKTGETWVGKPSGGAQPDIPLNQLGVFPKHCVFTRADSTFQVLLKPEEGTDATFVNGEKVEGETELKHGDRVGFGQSLFVFVNPKEGSAKQLLEGEISFESAKKELAVKQGDVRIRSPEEIEEERKRQEEYDARLKEAESARLAAEELARSREEAFAQQIRELQGRMEQEQTDGSEEQRKQLEEMQRVLEMERKQAEESRLAMEKQQRELVEAEKERRLKEIDMKMLDEQLMAVMPLCKEANLIAKELNKPYKLSTKLQVRSIDARRRKTDVVIVVEFQGRPVYEWTPDTLENRVFIMRELFDRCCEEGDSFLNALPQEEDPFWDPILTERLVGSSRIFLESLTMQLENEVEPKIMSADGKPVGRLNVAVWPISNSTGDTAIPDEEIVDDPSQLQDDTEPLKFGLHVKEATGLPSELCSDVRIEYKFYLDEESIVILPSAITSGSGSPNPVWDYERLFEVECVTQRFLTYLKEDAITFHLFATDSRAREAQIKREAEEMASPAHHKTEEPTGGNLSPQVEEEPAYTVEKVDETLRKSNPDLLQDSLLENIETSRSHAAEKQKEAAQPSKQEENVVEDLKPEKVVEKKEEKPAEPVQAPPAAALSSSPTAGEIKEETAPRGPQEAQGSACCVIS